MDILAHRGNSGQCPENTLAAFRSAADLPIDGVELDVQVTADNQLVVFHDFTLDRTTDGSGQLKAQTLEQLRVLDAGSWFDTRFAGERIPLLSEALDILPDHFLVNLELKSAFGNIPEALAPTLKELLEYYPKKRFVISSFNHRLVADISKRLPDTPLGLLSSADLIDPIKAMTDIAPLERFISYHPDKSFYSEATNRVIKDQGLKTLTWTVNTEQDARALSKNGADAIITNYPEQALSWKLT